MSILRQYNIKVFQGKYVDAIEVFDKIIQKNPKIPSIYNNKGFCLLRMNKYLESVQAFQNAIQNKKDFSEAYNNLGFAFKKLGDYAKSKENFLKAIEYKDNYFQAFNNLTILFLEENNLEQLFECGKGHPIILKKFLICKVEKEGILESKKGVHINSNIKKFWPWLLFRFKTIVSSNIFTQIKLNHHCPEIK